MLADSAGSDGDWLIALAQDSGRGRQGRAWASESGNFYGSTIVELQSGDPAAPSLSLAAGLALIEAVDAAVPKLPLLLKWPNDLMLAGKKLAGILLERSGDRVVVGFGVNLASAPELPDRATASLGGAITPQAFGPLIAASFAQMLKLWRSATPADVARAWQVRAHPIGTELSIHLSPEERIGGKFVGLGRDGGLLLELPTGEVRLVHAGDVQLS